MTFSYVSELDYDQPFADAGENQNIETSIVTLDGSNSSDPSGNALNYQWTQVYGPSALSFANPNAAITNISDLIDGVYLIRLKVDNGEYSDFDEIFIFYGYSSTQELSNTLEINYYPNPVDDRLYLNLPEGKNYMEVYSLRGELIAEMSINDQSFVYNMEHYHTGTYLFKIYNQSRVKVFKVVK